MVCFASFLPTPHPLTQSTLTGLSHSFTHVKSSPQHQQWIGLCVPQFALSHLPPPSHALTQSTLAGLSHSFTCINPCHGWLCPHLHLTPCLLTLPHNPHTVLWLAVFTGYVIGGLGAH